MHVGDRAWQKHGVAKARRQPGTENHEAAACVNATIQFVSATAHTSLVPQSSFLARSVDLMQRQPVGSATRGLGCVGFHPATGDQGGSSYCLAPGRRELLTIGICQGQRGSKQSATVSLQSFTLLCAAPRGAQDAAASWLQLC